MKYRRRIKRRFNRAAREKYRKARSRDYRINENNEIERILGKKLEMIQDCNGRKESVKFYKQVNRIRESWHLSCRHTEK
jgi:hypothetical protein